VIDTLIEQADRAASPVAINGDERSRYAVERLPNGLIRVFDRASQLRGCYREDGSYVHGDLRYFVSEFALRMT